MEPIVWTDSFETGVETIDHDHRGLIELINRLGQTVDASEQRESLEPVFDQLFDYACTHFVNEEWLMQQVGVDQNFITAHCSEHSHFLSKVQSLRLLARDATRQERSALYQFLSSWLVQHVLGTDQVAARQITAILAGSTAAEAAADARANRLAVQVHPILLAARERLREAAEELQTLAVG